MTVDACRRAGCRCAGGIVQADARKQLVTHNLTYVNASVLCVNRDYEPGLHGLPAEDQ
jgi:hypothetical protein